MSERPRRVVVTGMGVISAGGCDVESFWSGLVAGRSGIGPITRFDASGFPSRIAAEVPVDPSPLAGAGGEWELRGPIAQYAAAAAHQAITESGVLDACGTDRIGISIAAGSVGYDHGELFAPCAAANGRTGETDWRLFADTIRRVLKPRSAERRTPGSIAALLAERYTLAGPVLCTMTACAGGTQAIGDALRWIQRGRADAVVTGGSDSELHPLGLASFCLLGALSTRNAEPMRASRPFDRERDGFVLGEGAGMLVLEERARALARGAHIYAEVSGFGSGSDAYRATDPHPEGVGAVLAMERALGYAGRAPADVDYINAHGTSTPANDRVETTALKRVFGERARRIPVSSTKSMLGHATVAAGALEAIAVAMTLDRQVIHPTINQDVPDPICDLDYVPGEARQSLIELALSNSFAFGGQTAALVLERHRP